MGVWISYEELCTPIMWLQFFSTGSLTTKSQKWHYKMTPRAPNFVCNNQFRATTKCILMFLTWCGTMGSGSCATEGEKQIDNIQIARDWEEA